MKGDKASSLKGPVVLSYEVQPWTHTHMHTHSLSLSLSVFTSTSEPTVNVLFWVAVA